MNLPEQPLAALISRYRSRYRAQSAQEQFRFVLFWGALLLSVLVIGLAGYHASMVSATIESKVHTLFAERPWVSGLIIVDGRDILLVGEVEPGSGIEHDMNMIARIDGVRSVVNRLSVKPRPSAHFVLNRNGKNLEMAGRMNGDDLATVTALVKNAFPGHVITDRIHIDDRLGRPFWLDGFSTSLDALESVGSFELDGWKDRIDVVGITVDDAARLRTGYAIPAALSRQVTVRNRLAAETGIGFPVLGIRGDFRGAQVTGTVASRIMRARLVAASRAAFGTALSHAVAVDPARATDSTLKRLMALFPALATVRNLRLTSSGDGFTVWGEVDSPRLLGDILHARRRLGLETLVTSLLEVVPAATAASLALLADRRQAVVSGVLPSVKARETLFGALHDIRRVETIVDRVSIRPDVAHSPWLEAWPALLAALPGNALGITIDDRNLLLTGTVPDRAQYRRIDARIAELLPHVTTLNWLVPADHPSRP